MKKPNTWKIWPGRTRRLLTEAQAIIKDQAVEIGELKTSNERRLIEAETRISDLCGARDWASRTIHSITRADHSFRREQESHAVQLRELRARIDLLEARQKES